MDAACEDDLELVEALPGVLAAAQRPGTWFASGVITTPLPLIEVAGVGPLSFPLPDAQYSGP